MLGARRAARRIAIVGMVWVFGGTTAVFAEDKLTEANMTQRDYERLTATESSVTDEAPTEPPKPVHNLTEEEQQKITEVGGAKVISGKDWRGESPEERDAHLRRIKETLPAGSKLIVSVPKGEVWVIPPMPEKGQGTPAYRYRLAVLLHSLRPWTTAERVALPVAVARSNPISQSDKRGTTTERVVARPDEEP
jgi:hypothetical protein